MNEDGTPIEVQEPSTDNIPASEGGETTTPEEVAELLNLQPRTVNEDDVEEDEVEDPETPEELEDDVAPEEDELPEELEEPEKEEDDEDAPTFELEVEDANGEKFTVKPGDDLEDVLKDFEPKNNGQIFAILQSLQKLEAEKSAYDVERAEKTAEAEKNAQLQEIQDGWNKEISVLQGQKRLDVSADGKHPERVEEVFKFMSEENDKRAKDGRPFIRSFEDALDKLELRETREAEAEKAKEEKELARKRGAMVGGSSAPATGGAPSYKGGARNSTEALRAMGML